WENEQRNYSMVQAKREDYDLDPLVMVVEWNECGICANYPTSIRQFLSPRFAIPAVVPTLSESLFCADGLHVLQKYFNIVDDLQRHYAFRNVPSLGRVYLVSVTRANVADIQEVHNNSSEETRKRAKNLADSIGSYHLNFNIDTIITCILTLFTMVTNKTPKFRVYGGSNVENLALQNIQARLRMVLSYLFAQLLPWVRNLTGSLLVLGCSNVDECLRGYLTKYDCSSADINPIGAISKIDLRKFIEYARNEFGLSILDELSSNHEPYLIIIIFLNAVPTAELEPITSDYVQSDEADMGMSYAELSVFGRLRKLNRCGPFSMFTKLVHEWSSELSPTEISKKVKKFYYYYSLNRHKMTTITPSYHAESYSVDDNRFDLRPFLYDTGWSWQFKKIDDFVKESEEKN
ncbi:14819_t:CDS:2, partial [Entrophospora sp. SA101]